MKCGWGQRLWGGDGYSIHGDTRDRGSVSVHVQTSTTDDVWREEKSCWASLTTTAGSYVQTVQSNNVISPFCCAFSFFSSVLSLSGFSSQSSDGSLPGRTSGCVATGCEWAHVYIRSGCNQSIKQLIIQYNTTQYNTQTMYIAQRHKQFPMHCSIKTSKEQRGKSVLNSI